VVARGDGEGEGSEEDKHKYRKAKIRRTSVAQQACKVIGQLESTWRKEGEMRPQLPASR